MRFHRSSIFFFLPIALLTKIGRSADGASSVKMQGVLQRCAVQDLQSGQQTEDCLRGILCH
jgi:hypothetical protein